MLYLLRDPKDTVDILRILSYWIILLKNHMEENTTDPPEGEQKIEFVKRTAKKRTRGQEKPMEFLEWTDEDERYNRLNPFLFSPDTHWMESLYDTLYPLSKTPRFKETFFCILTNLSLRKEAIFINLHKSAYKDTYLPPSFLPTGVSQICNDLQRNGYVVLTKGYKLPGRYGVATIIEPTEKLLSLVPPEMRYGIKEEGLVIPKEITFDTFPDSVLETRKLLSEYNMTVEPENMLYATHKGSFEVDGRFTGSKVILMPKEERKNIKIDGEDTVELDVSNCLPFLLYADYAVSSLPKDAYDIERYPRKLVKKALLMALNCGSRKEAKKALQSFINYNYKGENCELLLDKLEEEHSPVKFHFYSGIGRRLMYLESSCMATFMRSMLDKGIKFYPIYDSVRVPVSKRDIAMEELRKAFTIGGREPKIHEEDGAAA